MSGVYILRDPVTDYLKIGRATNFDERLANLRTANPRLILLEWVETTFDSLVESYVHNRLARFRKEGEFFQVSHDTVKQEIREALELINQRPSDESLQAVADIQSLAPARDAVDGEVSLLLEILAVRSELGKLKLKESVLLDQLKVSVGENAGLNNWVTYSATLRQSIDTLAIRRDLPEIAEKYTVKTVSRTLKIQPFIRQREVSNDD